MYQTETEQLCQMHSKIKNNNKKGKLIWTIFNFSKSFNHSIMLAKIEPSARIL